MTTTEIDSRDIILTSPPYREHIQILYPLYVQSREERANPKNLLLIQSVLAEALKLYQDEKRKLEKEKSELDIMLAKRLIKVVQDITDGIAWRALRYNGLLIQRLASKQKTGYLEKTFTKDFDVAAQIIEEHGCLVVVNDLTRVLRYGDLTIVDNDRVYICENKGGEASATDGRASRQRQRLKEFCQFYNTKSRIEKGEQEILANLDIPFETYLPKVGEAINIAGQEGYCQLQISECLMVEAFFAEQGIPKTKPRPFIRFDNLQLFSEAATRHAPYTIYPFDNQTCFGLATGRIFLVSYLDIPALQSRFAQSNLSLSFPDNSQLQSVYENASIGEQKKAVKKLRFVVKDKQNPNTLLLDGDLLALLFIEYLKEDTLIDLAKKLLQQVKPKKEELIRIYPGFGGEERLWD